MAATKKFEPQLGWLYELPEGGDSTRRHVQREEELLARREDLLRQLADMEKELARVRAAALAEIKKQWDSGEIAQAQKWYKEASTKR